MLAPDIDEINNKRKTIDALENFIQT